MTAKIIARFSVQLDGLLGLSPNVSKTNEPQIEIALQVAGLLDEMNFDAELAPRADIRSKWTQQPQRSIPNRFTRQLSASRWTWTFILVILFALLVAFRQPVFAAVSRMFGYVYISDIGFLPMESTLMLEQPILQEHNGQTVTVTRGVATSENIIVFLDFNDIARPVDGAWLETSAGERLEPLEWQYSPNAPASRGIQIIFPPLPSDITQTTLTLPEGWHLPLTWIPVSQSNLPDVRTVPYAEQTPETPNLCVEKYGINLCLLAATTSVENTSVLIQAQSTNPQLIAGSVMQGLVWQTETEQVKLTDEQGNAFPMDSEQNGTLSFAPLAGNQKVTLTIPALLASVDIPDQNIVVDMGSDPQPDTVIPLDVNVQVLNTTVHFSQAAFVGDGVNSLRLTLNADEPLQTVDGLTPASLELGKPERIDDLYGTGMLAGSKDIFIELIRLNGKITGVINIPIVGAMVIVDGPFEFTFNLTDDSSPAPTPAEADPNIFSPAPTPMPIPLDGYFYSGLSLNPDDLLYTVLDGDNTNVYVFTPNIDQQPRLLATLPGSVSQVYVHPDHLGMDYLAGSHKFRDEIFYIDNISLYTVRFDESAPHLLFNFPPNPENTVGTTVAGDWSYDGLYSIFLYAKPIPGSDSLKFLVLDMTCRANENCTPHEISLSPNLALYKAYFSPNDYRILFTGSDYSGTGETDLFVMNFIPKNSDNEIRNITADSTTLSDDVGVSPALWSPAGRIFTVCSDGKMATMFCYVDPTTGKIDSGQVLTDHLLNYQVSPSGKYVLGIVINHNAPGKGILEIHKFDLNAQAGPALAGGRMFPFAAISPSDQFIAYTTENSDQVQIVDSATGNTSSIYSSDVPNTVTWLGWVR